MRAYAKQGRELYMLRFDIPVAELRIADFTGFDKDTLEQSIFHHAEGCKFFPGLDDYTFSQVVASIVSPHFDGMRVRGVRGENGAYYSNFVLFHNFSHWETWTENYSPYPVKVI